MSTEASSNSSLKDNLKKDKTPKNEDQDLDSKSKDRQDEQHGTHECNICFETANDPVVSMCGHLFCWPCIHQWLEIRPERQTCPVCKAGISKEKVIPIYGRGNPNPQDPRQKLPPRPSGQRSEPESSNRFQNFRLGSDGNVNFSFGFGAFPFGMFASTFNFSDGRHRSPTGNIPQPAEEQFLSKVLLWVAIIFICWLIIV